MTTCVRLWQSARKKLRKWASCQAPLANRERSLIGETIYAVKKPSDTGRWRQLWLKKVASEARAINLCQQCYKEKLVQQGKQPLKSKEWREVVERKAHRCRLWKIFGSEQFLRGMWGCFTFTRAWARKIPADATQAKQEGIQGQWQHESLFKVEQVKRSADTDCNAQMMRRAYNAKQLDNWESFKEECRKEGQLGEWTIERLQEAYDKVALEDLDGALGGYSEKEHGLLETDHRSSRRNGRSHFVVRLSALQQLLLG